MRYAGNLEGIFERKSVFNRFCLKRKLITLRWDNETLQEHILKLEALANELEGLM